MRNTQKIGISTVLFEKAKKDYATGFYAWYHLKRKYPQLTVKEIFKVIF